MKKQPESTIDPNDIYTFTWGPEHIWPFIGPESFKDGYKLNRIYY